MERQVYKRGNTNIIITLIIVTIAVIYIYHATNNALVLFILLVFGLSSIFSMKSKLVIEQDKLYFERFFFSIDIPLKEVSQITIQRLDTMSTGSERSSKQYVVVYDNHGKFVFKFPYAYIAGKQKQQFKDAIHASNPKTRVHLEANIIDLNVLRKDFEEHKKRGKDEENL